ncbi:MAG: GNAT family N-acetyltransferase [Actinobacteria bacterium]|nr:GNAT family N-acetyltransferase [Actinomycetota bacterium]
MTFVADTTLECGHTYLTDGRDAAMTWVTPDLSSLSLLSRDALARGRAILAEHSDELWAEAAFTTILAARAHDLSRFHWTLQYLGIRTYAQGTGLGRAIVEPVLATVNDEGLECELVSSNSRNLSFYERLGFSVVGEVTTPDGAVTLRPMHRPAAAR